MTPVVGLCMQWSTARAFPGDGAAQEQLRRSATELPRRSAIGKTKLGKMDAIEIADGLIRVSNLSTASRNATTKVYASRRRRIRQRTDTYVLLERGMEEKFVTRDELHATLKRYLENWPKTTLPPDLARFESVDEAVSFLASSACELEIEGDVDSVQWYEVRLDEDE